MDLRQLPAIDALSLFQIGGKIHKKEKKLRFLPRVDDYLGEEGFGDFGISWSPEGLYITVKVDRAFKGSVYPEIAKGDGVTVFIDTRGIESAVVVHKYCHHFVFLPKEKDGMIGAEVTHFRFEDKHELCAADQLEVRSEFFSNKYTMHIFIPESCLFGYDPFEYRKIGLAYIIHRGDKDATHFPLTSDCYKLESSPALWAKFRLV